MNSDRLEDNWKQLEGKKKYQNWNFGGERPDAARNGDPISAEAQEPSASGQDKCGRGKLASRVD